MGITWRPHPSDPLAIYASAFPGEGEPYTLDFGGNDVRMMYPKVRPALKVYPAAGTYLVFARTLKSGLIAQTEIVVRAHMTPRIMVSAVSARRVRLRIDHPGTTPVRHQVNWGVDNTWTSHGEDDLELEYVYPRTPGGPPTITVLDAPAQRSATARAPVAKKKKKKNKKQQQAFHVEGVVHMRPAGGEL